MADVPPVAGDHPGAGRDVRQVWVRPWQGAVHHHHPQSDPGVGAAGDLPALHSDDPLLL